MKKTVIAFLLSFPLMLTAGLAGEPRDLGEMAGGRSLSVDNGSDRGGGIPNQADVNHPNIHDKVGGGKNGPRANANPNGNTDRGGDIHGIGNNPGQSDTNPNDDGTPGNANELGDMHGGIGDVNKNVD